MRLDEGWQVADTSPGRCASPADLEGAALDWLPARVPGTAAGAVGAGGRDFDAHDWWFRCRFAAAGPDGSTRSGPRPRPSCASTGSPP